MASEHQIETEQGVVFDEILPAMDGRFFYGAGEVSPRITSSLIEVTWRENPLMDEALKPREYISKALSDCVKDNNHRDAEAYIQWGVGCTECKKGSTTNNDNILVSRRYHVSVQFCDYDLVEREKPLE